MARILVIDDEPDVRAILRDMLVEAGHEVLLAGDGKEGLALYREHQPRLVITDIKMPAVDGIAVILELAWRADVSIIGMSGWGEDFLSEVRDMGALRTLEKPFTRDDLLAATSDALGL